MHFDSIYPLLAMKLQGRNEAIGLRGITGQVANLLELYISSRQEMTNTYAQAFYYQMMIKEKVREFDQLMADVEAGNPPDDPFGQGKQIELQVIELASLLQNLEGANV